MFHAGNFERSLAQLKMMNSNSKHIHLSNEMRIIYEYYMSICPINVTYLINIQIIILT